MPSTMQVAVGLYAILEMLLRVLFACLRMSAQGFRRVIHPLSNLSRLANFCADDLPLVHFIFLDGGEECLTLLEHQQLTQGVSRPRRTSSSANSA